MSLPNDISRCRPKSCTMRLKCLRALAEIPKYGGIVNDFEHQMEGGTALCSGLLTSVPVKKKAEAPVKPAVRGL